MRIFVCIKQVPDTETKVQLNAEKTGLVEDSIKWIMNPYDEYAVEEALKLKAQSPECQVTLVGLGPQKRVTEALRTGLAMGADDAIVVDTSEWLDSLASARAIAQTIKGEGDFQFIFTGKLAIDNNASSFSSALAELLNIPHATVVSKFSSNGETSTVEREVEGGTKEVIELNGPCLVAANKGLNQPRYASLPGIMKAKKKPLKVIELSALNISSTNNTTTFSNYELPPVKSPVQILAGDFSAQVQSLVKKLREESKVI